MNIKDNHNRRVTFDIGDELGDKIDKLTVMIGKLAARDSRSGRQFKPPIEVVMIDAIMISEFIKIGIGQIVEIGENTDIIEVE